MAKHPTPKQKKGKSKVKKRYGSFKTTVLKKLTNSTKLVPCQDCGEKVLAHHACPSCGKYRGRQVIDKKKAIEKITKVKA